MPKLVHMTVFNSSMKRCACLVCVVIHCGDCGYVLLCVFVVVGVIVLYLCYFVLCVCLRDGA
jgi:hypothetical protein